MKKRFTFKCWSCKRKYTLFKEITDEQELIVACPFCNNEAIVRLDPYRKPIKKVLRVEGGEEQFVGYEYDFPDEIPTQKPESQ